MRSKVLRWGNSLGLPIPAVTAREMRVAAGSIVDLQLTKGSLVVRPVPGAATLESLIGPASREATRPMGPARFRAWVPGLGDLIWVSSAPSAEPGIRIAFVVSPGLYATKMGRALVCDVVDEAGASPFGVEPPHGLPIGGAIAVDRVHTLDWRARGVRLVCRVPDEVTRKVRERLLALVG